MISKHSPTLNTIRMVECTLKDIDDSVITIADLKRKLPKKINHTVLKTILEYLEESNKIAVSIRGLSWVHNPSRKMRLELSKGSAYPEDFPK